jgi:hypothetical protein
VLPVLAAVSGEPGLNVIMDSCLRAAPPPSLWGGVSGLHVHSWESWLQAVLLLFACVVC